MCLAVPGKVVAVRRGSEPLTGTVDFGGVRKEICLAWVPDVREGEYVVVHVGFAIETIDEAEARTTLDLIARLDAFNDGERP